MSIGHAELPPPLVPPGIDLRSYRYMPMFLARIFGSTFHASTNDAEWRAGVTLWWKSWWQTPAGSLPDNDVELCRLAELGTAARKWARVRRRALHGWIKCSDGRLYHPVIAEVVFEVWKSKSRASRKARDAAFARWHPEDPNQPGLSLGTTGGNFNGSEPDKSRTSEQTRSHSQNCQSLMRHSGIERGENIEQNQRPADALSNAQAMLGDANRIDKERKKERSSAEQEIHGPFSDPAIELISAFDRGVTAIYGKTALERAYPHPTDRSTARTWLDAGADAATVEFAVRVACAARLARGERPPRALSGLSMTISGAIGAGRRPLPESRITDDPGSIELPPLLDRSKPWYDRFGNFDAGKYAAAMAEQREKGAKP